MTFIAEKTIGQIAVGDTASFSHIISGEDIDLFIRVSGDVNPLHSDEAYAKETKFGRPIVHGMYLGALCSCFVGVYLPGKYSLYLGQDLIFRHPVFVGDAVEVAGHVISKSDSTRIVQIKIEMRVGESVIAEGTAKVQLLA